MRSKFFTRERDTEEGIESNEVCEGHDNFFGRGKKQLKSLLRIGEVSRGVLAVGKDW